MRGIISISIAMYILAIGDIAAQTRSQLEKERAAIIEQIELTTKKLSENQSTKRNTIQDLKAIEAQIKNRQSLIKNIKKQLENATSSIVKNHSKMDSLDIDLTQTRKRNQKLLRNAYLRQIASNKWANILSASSVSDAFLRWRYTMQYEDFVRRKTSSIVSSKSQINRETGELVEEKKYIQSLLDEQKKNQQKLIDDQKEKDKILKNLKLNEKKLRSDLKEKKQQRKKLNQEIERIILSGLKGGKSIPTTSHISKKSLYPPVKGYISSHFGKHPHPTLKNITIENNGVDITAQSGAPVSSVLDGEVISTSKIAGFDHMVIIRHGDYYSVYSKLHHVIVSKGDTVKKGQTIGRLNDNHTAVLHFEFWKGKKKQNPTEWIKE